MNNPAVIGAIAGLVSALLFVSKASATMLALLFFPIVPLPLMIAGFGWGIQAGLIGLLSGAIVSATLGLAGIVQYTLVFAGPAVLLIYLALLSRPDPQPAAGEPARIWYPPGHLIAWTALLAGAIGAGLAIVLAFGAGGDYEAGVRQTVEQGFLPALREATEESLSKEQIDQFIATATVVLPAGTATLWLIVMLVNMWLGGKIALFSGRLIRPWPTFSEMQYPRFLSVAFLLALVGTMLAGLTSAVASAFTGAFIMAYLLLGLVVIHVITRGSRFQPVLLVLLYVGIVVVGWIGLIVALLGIAEPLIRLRERVAQGSGPGGPPDTPPRE